MTAPQTSAPRAQTRASEVSAPQTGVSPLRSPLHFLPLQGRKLRAAEWVMVAAGIYVLITAVMLIGSGFKLAAGDSAGQLFQFASNPFVGLMIGLLATALTQSSSTTTSITVGMVAGGLPIEIAIPIMLGANIGTTMTSTLVSLGMSRDRETFRRAFGAATVHDMYNLLSVAIFLPLELMFGVLQRSSQWLTAQTSGTDGGAVATVFGGVGEGVQFITAPGSTLITGLVSPLPDVAAGLLLILIGVVGILAVINLIGKLLKVLMVGRAQRVLHAAIGRSPISGIASGTLITVMVQSSTTTTSLAVPLAGSGTFTLRQIYPFTIGANIGTTLTALIAAFAFTGPEAGAALQAAYVHMLYNIFCALVIFGLPLLRSLPVKGASWLANLAVKSKLYVAAWVLGVFIILPVTLIVATVW